MLKRISCAIRNGAWRRPRRLGRRRLSVVERLFANRVLDHLRAAQGLLRLGDQYSRDRLEAACSRALNFGTPTYRTIKQILKDGLDQQPELLDAPSSKRLI